MNACPHAHDAGAYVLGALSPAERLEFERHLARCHECTRSVRELAGLPGLLGRIDPRILEDRPANEPVPETLLPALTRSVQQAADGRRTRTWLALAAAAVAVVATLVVTFVTGNDPRDTTADAGPSRGQSVAMRPVGEVPVRAELTLEQVTWGTRLDLTCTYDTGSVEYELPSEVDYWLVLRTRDGHSERVGSWRSVDGETLRLPAATATDRDEIASVEVRAEGGRVVLRLAL